MCLLMCWTLSKKASKLRRAVKGLYPVLEQDQHTKDNQSMELFGRITAKKLAIALRATGVLLFPLESAIGTGYAEKI